MADRESPDISDLEAEGEVDLGFRQVDAMADPQELIWGMDQTGSIPAVRHLRHLSASWLAPRPGERLLDVGCGAGDVAIELAHLVGDTGDVLGIDASVAMIEEATHRARALAAGVPVTFRVGDVLALDLDDHAFDTCRCERTLQWLSEPERAVAEMVRVLCPGGRLSIIDTDWGTLTLDHPDPITTKALHGAMLEYLPNAFSGRRLTSQLRQAGLVDLNVESAVIVSTAWDPTTPLMGNLMPPEAFVSMSERRGAVRAEAGAAWLERLRAEATEGRFFLSLTMFAVSARRPPDSLAHRQST